MRYFLACFLLATSLFANKPNHLLGQTSPYLKQHLYNPVDWYPWGKKAFLKAKKEHKMIFLSIGYSTCHWCHVMENESFSDKKVAKLLNKYFVSIKVDKEEMPQVDKYYQKLYQNIYKRRGGWPLNVFLTEDMKPFLIAKYIPKTDAYGSTGLTKLVEKLGKIYQKDRSTIKKLANQIINKENLTKKISTTKQKDIIKKGFKNIKNSFDKKYKGFGENAKYPKSSVLNFLIDYYKVYNDKNSFDMVVSTLKKMQKSSIYDIISGGFFRYTTDREWNSPHFEKMLYSNAQIIDIYVKVYRLTHIKEFKNTIKKSINEFDKHFSSKERLYYSASDANSNGMEGGYYLFKYDTILQKVLSFGANKQEALETFKYLDIEKEGNYDSEYALPFAKGEKKPKSFEKLVTILRQIKEKRAFPFLDKKIITSWNAMMIKTKLDASDIFPKYKKEALKSLQSLLKLMQKSDSSLFHQTLSGTKPTQKGVLEDYAYLCDALLSAYETTLDKKYLDNAFILAKIAIKKFYLKKRWYLDEDKMTLADGDDRYYTSSLSIMLKDILNLATLKSSIELKKIFTKSTFAFKNEMIRNSLKYAQMLDNLLKYQEKIVVIKSNRKNLLKHKKEIAKIDYPFLLKEAIKSDKFLSCNLSNCFGYGTFKKVKKAITSLRPETLSLRPTLKE